MPRYRTAKLAILAGVALAFELAAFDALPFRGARAEALLVLACFAALFARDSRQGLLASWIVGLVKDLATAAPFGLYALLFLGAGWGVLQIRQILFREHALTQLAVAFVAACGVNAAAGLFVAATTGGIPAGVLVGKTLASALLTAVLAPGLLLLLARVKWLVR